MKYAIFLVSLISCQAMAGENFVTEAKKAVIRNLKDPDSAKFRNLRTIKTDKGLRLLCGEMNGKNSYGGYTGYVPFISDGDVLVYVGDDLASKSTLQDLYGKQCRF